VAGDEVEAHSLQTASLNGARGHVTEINDERIGVSFPPPISNKALKPANVKHVRLEVNLS